MSTMDNLAAAQAVRAADSSPAFALVCARALGDDGTVEALDLLLALACDQSLSEQLLNEIGRSAGRAALRTGRVDDVDQNWLPDFIGEAYLGYDTELSIASLGTPETA
jgi:hypothetical protein